MLLQKQCSMGGIYQSWHLRWEAGACKTGGHYRRFFGCKFLSTEEPVLCLPELSQKQVKNRGPVSQFFDVIVYLQEAPVLCLRKLSQSHVKYRGPLSPMFSMVSSGGAGTLPVPVVVQNGGCIFNTV